LRYSSFNFGRKSLTGELSITPGLSPGLLDADRQGFSPKLFLL